LGLRDVDGDPSSRPDVVEVDARRHHRHEDVGRAQLRDVDHLVLDRILRVAVALGSHQHRVHLSGHLADRRKLTELVDVLAHGSHPSEMSRQPNVRAP
jgi:hypothetical protein